MSNQAFSQLFSRWVNRVRRSDSPRDPRRGRARLRVEQVEDRLAPATLPPQVIPAATVEETRVVGTPPPIGPAIDNYSGIGDFQPQVVASPTDPNTLVYVAANGGGLRGQYSRDGGANWLPFAFNGGAPALNLRTATNGINPATGLFEGNARDPLLSPSVTTNVYTNVSNPSITMGRDGTVYIAYLLHNAAKTSGAVALRAFQFTTPTTMSLVNGGPGNGTRLLYRWAEQDPASNVVVAIDNNPSATYTDPTNATTTATNTNVGKAVYVAWNTNATTATQVGYGPLAPFGFNRNTVWLAASRDRGNNFSTPVQVNAGGASSGDGWFFAPGDGAQAGADAAASANPVIVFSSDTLNPNVALTQGQMNIFFTRVNSNNLFFDNTTPDAGIPTQEAVETFSFAGQTGGIIDATVPPNSTAHSPGITNLTATVNFPVGQFFRSTDINVGLSLTHTHLNQLEVQLIPPNGSGLAPIILLDNRTNAAGQDSTIPIGLPDVPDLGHIRFDEAFVRSTPGVVGVDNGPGRGGMTVFDDEGPRWLIDPVSDFGGGGRGWIGHYRPEPGNFLSDYYNKTSAQLTGADGKWTLRVTDHRNDVVTTPEPAPRVDAWSITFTSRLSNDWFGQDAVIPSVSPPVVASSPLRSAVDDVNVTLPPVSPTLGVGPGLSVAYDNSFGSASPFAGRMYMVYTAVGGGGADTDIYFQWSNTNGLPVPGFIQWSGRTRLNTDTAGDHFTEGNRTQFQPSVAVDPLTGTIVVTWYDGRFDASNARTVRYISTSIDGGETWSEQVPLNNMKTAEDSIDRSVEKLEPVPGNLVNAGTFGFGTRQALVVHGGRVNTFWTGNENSAGTNAYTATVRLAAGPRIVFTDMGATTTESRVRIGQKQIGPTPPTPLQDVFFEYNNSFAPDGTRMIDGFIVRFDRVINPATFTAADIEVRFRGPNTPLGTPGTLIRTLDPVALVWDPAGTTRDSTPDFLPNTVFFIPFADAGGLVAQPQSSVGTYSYSVGSGIQDLIQNPVGITLVEPTAPYNAPFTNTTGGAITPGTNPGPDSTGILNSPIDITTALPTGQVIGQVVVDVNINHSRTGDLRINLIAPFNNPATGLPFTITLFGARAAFLGGTGDNLLNTRFEDSGGRFIFRADVGAPFTGSFRPETAGALAAPNQPVQSLAALMGFSTTVGTWTLRVEDVNGNLGVDGDTGLGSLLNWSLTILPGVANSFANPSRGNFVDQNANGQPLQLPSQFSDRDRTSDTTTVPTAVNGRPFEITYRQDSLPLLAPGPHVTAIASAATKPVVNAVAFNNAFPTGAPFPTFGSFLLPTVDETSVVVTFDRQINPYSVEADARDLLSLTQNGSPVTGTFRIIPVYLPPPLSLSYPPPPPPPIGTPTNTYRITRTTGGALTAGTYAATFGTGIQPTDNLVLNTGTNSLDVTFDRDMNSSTFTPADVLRMTGPIGGIIGPFTVTPVNAAGVPTPGLAAARTFRVGFPTQTMQGPYSLEFGADIAAATGELLDNNFNAGLEVLRGNGQPLVGNNPVATYNTNPGPVTIPANGSATLDLVVPDSFRIAQDLNRFPDAIVQVLLNVQHPNTPDLIGELVAPDGLTRITLFNRVGTPGAPNQTNFENTRFVDAATFNGQPTSPIQSAQPPFDPGASAYTPQRPLSTPLIGTRSDGTWKLVITNLGVNVGTLVNFSLSLPFLVTGNGLGEPNADRFSGGFRSFIQDPTNAQSQQVWTPVGPTSTNQVGQSTPNASNNAGRVTAIAVDGSDPSGNTVYAGGESGGVWKTTNFLTTNPEGPHWVPLTDFGPTTSMNIGSIAVFPRNNDPNQTIIFALTGSGDDLTAGVGVLRSLDGGRSWVLLDSATTNVDANGVILPVTNAPLPAVQRDRAFVGSTGFKIVVDPKLSPANEVIVYMALSDPNNSGGAGSASAGVWRSKDSGDTWQRIQDGQATDFILGNGSAGANGNLQFGYAAIRNQGVLFTSQAPDVVAGGFITRNGGEGNGLIQDAITQQPIQVQAVTGPGNVGGRITLSTPVITNDPLKDSFYRSWLYALAANPDGSVNALYQSKDDGRNWTLVRLPMFEPAPSLGFGTNNETRVNTDPFDKDEAGAPGTTVGKRGGNETMSLAIDPIDPNIVYVGGTGPGNDAALPISGLVRVDTTITNSQQSLVFWDNSAGGVGPQAQADTLTAGAIGALYTATGAPNDRFGSTPLSTPPFFPDNVAALNKALNDPTGGVYTTYDAAFGGLIATGFLNLIRDPDNPFLSNATLRVNNVDETLGFTNNGHNATYTPFSRFLQSDAAGPRGTLVPIAVDIHRLLTIVDPVTGTARLIAGTDQGIYTGVDDGNGNLTTGIGTTRTVAKSRNGNLQISQFYSGAVQPSQLAADIARAMFYGISRDNGFPVSSANAVTTGNTNWTGQLFHTGIIDPVRELNPASPPEYRDGSGTMVAVDQTGSGSAYEFRWPCCESVDEPLTDFFRYLPPGTGAAGGVSRTNGLVRGQGVDRPIDDIGQWPIRSEEVGFFAVNPIDNRGIVIASRQPGNQGRVYRTTDQGLLWTQIADVNQLDNFAVRSLAYGAPSSTNTGQLNNFIYAGTIAGNVYFTETGGAPWTQISQGLTAGPNDPILQIVPNPRRGSRDAFAITPNHVYYRADARAGAWIDVTANLFQIQRSIFGKPLDTAPALDPNGRGLTTIVADWRYQIPVNPADPNSPTYPILYVGGEGGVFRSRTILDPLNQEWTFFPDVETEGAPAEGGYLPNVLVTDLDLSIGNLDPASGLPQGNAGLNMLVATTFGRGQFAVRLDPDLPSNSFVSGPRVIQITNPNPVGGPSTRLRVRFDGPVDPVTFTSPDVVLRDPNGNAVQITGVTLISPNGANGSNPRDFYEFTFATQSPPGLYTLTIGQNISDLGGNLMNQDADRINGEPIVDAFSSSIFLNGTSTNNLQIVPPGIPSTITAGQPVTFTVRATDQNGNTLTALNGPVTLTSTDPNFTFSPAAPVLVNGVGTFTVTFTTSGPQSVTVAFTAGGINPVSGTTTVLGAAAGTFELIDTPDPVTAGNGTTFTVIARDQFGNEASGYNGTLTITSDDPSPQAVIPQSVTLTNGQGTFVATFVTAGSRITNVADATDPTLTGTEDTQVSPQAANRFIVAANPTTVELGGTVTFTVTAIDQFDNQDTNYNGPITVGVTDPSATVTPANPVLTGGAGTFTIIFNTLGLQDVTVINPADAAVTGRVDDILVTPVIPPPPPPNPTDDLVGDFAVGSGAGGSPIVKVYNPNGSPKFSFTPFPAGFAGQVDPFSEGFTGGHRVAVGDVTGDGVADIVVGNGPTISSFVKIIDGATQQEILVYQPFEPAFLGGVYVSVGDITGDGIADIAITPDESGGPRVQLLRGGTAGFPKFADFFGIDDPAFRGGARTAIGDVTGDDVGDLVVSAGFGGGPRISTYDGAALNNGQFVRPFGDFFIFEQSLRNGAYVTVGDLDGDGFADIVGGGGPGGGPRVFALSSQDLLNNSVRAIANFFAGNVDNRGGIKLAAKDLDGDRLADLVVGDGDGAGSRVTAYRGTTIFAGNPTPQFAFDAFGDLSGVFVG